VKKQEGFTLIELVVAVGLMAVMFTALSVVFGQATKLIRRSEAEVELFQTFRMVYKIMKKDFESIVNYEEPVFYNRYDESGNANPKLDYCGYLRIEDDAGTTDGRKCDNISFLASNPERMEIRNYLYTSGAVSYVKTHVRGTDLVEISYAVEDESGNIVKNGGSAGDRVYKRKLMRYARKVVEKEFVSATDEGRGLYGLVYKFGLTADLVGRGTYGMDVFNGSGTDRTVWIDHTVNPPVRKTGRDPAPNKYGERAVLAEGVCGFDVKYWFYRADNPHADWTGAAWTPPSGKPDPYVAVGHFYDGMPPNPACSTNNANLHPNWWYLPRMMQVRLTLTDSYQLVEQDFWFRVYLPSCSPRPKVP